MITQPEDHNNIAKMAQRFCLVDIFLNSSYKIILLNNVSCMDSSHQAK